MKTKFDLSFFSAGSSALLFMLMQLLSSCSSSSFLSCPYSIDEPVVEIDAIGIVNTSFSAVDSDPEAKIYEIAAAYFSVFNACKKNISEITVSMMVFDSEGNNPFVGSNCIVASFEKNICPYESCRFTFPLDSFVSEIPEEPYQIGSMYLQKIKYDDGKVWTDPFGMYAVKEYYD